MGWNNIHITINSRSNNGGGTCCPAGNDAVVNYLPAALLHLGGGVRWQPPPAGWPCWARWARWARWATALR